MDTPKINQLISALVKVQSEMKMIEKDGTAKAGTYSYEYATLPQVISHLLPILTKNKLAVSQTTEIVEGSMRLVTHLLHESGESMTSSYLLPSGLDSQKMGSAITYARRYSLMALVSLAAEDEDDDGATASQTPNSTSRSAPSGSAPLVGQASTKQVEMIRSLSSQKGCDVQIIMFENDVQSLDMLSKQQASNVINDLLKLANKEVAK